MDQKRNALIVGINNYPTSPLKHCISDAEDIGKLLEKNYDGKPNFNTTIITDTVRKSSLKCSLVKHFSKATDVALLYFAGHGAVDAFGYHIVTPDAEDHDMGVPMTQLLAIVNGSPAKNKIVILDCCHSGGMDESARTWGGISISLCDGVVILASSRADQRSKGVNGHGIFTNLFIEALKGGAADLNGNITPGSIYAYIDKALGPGQQRPVFKTNISEFISLRQVEPQVPADILQRISEFFPDPEHEYPLNPSYEDSNHPDVVHEVCEPYAIAENVAWFKQLQKLQSVGLVVPVRESYMYYAAMHRTGCRLTPLGKHYWKLANDKNKLK